MASVPLATVTELRAMLGADAVTQEQEPRALEHLMSASEAVREAAGQHFTRATTTVTLPGGEGTRLRLPQRPVVSVDTVIVEPLLVGSVPAEPWEDTAWRLVGGELERAGGWGRNRLPVNLTVTYTHGYLEVPRPVRDLVIQMAIAALTRVAEEGMLGSMPGVTQESISQSAHALTFGSDESAPSSVFELSERTRRWLRRDYGAGEVGVVTSR